MVCVWRLVLATFACVWKAEGFCCWWSATGDPCDCSETSKASNLATSPTCVNDGGSWCSQDGEQSAEDGDQSAPEDGEQSAPDGEQSAPEDGSSSCACRSIVAGISDVWCQQSDCDPAFAAQCSSACPSPAAPDCDAAVASALSAAQEDLDTALARAEQAEAKVDALEAQAAQDGLVAVDSSSDTSVDMGFCTYEMNDVTISTPCADLDTHMTTGQVSAIQANDQSPRCGGSMDFELMDFDGGGCRDCGELTLEMIERDIAGLEEEPTVPGSCTSGYGNAPIAFLREASLSMSLSGNSLLASIDALTSLTSIGGSLTISNNPVLANLDGLRNLRKVARGFSSQLVIQDNPGLTSLELSNLREMGGTSLTIKGNTALRTISFPSLTELGFQGWELGSSNGVQKKQWTINGGGNFVIEGCSSLETISAPVLRQIGHSLIIQDNGDYALNEGSVFSLEKIGAYVTRAHYQSIIYTVHGVTCSEFFPECFSKQTDQGPLYSYPPATCTGLGLDFFGLSGCPTCEQEWDLTACAHTRNTLCGVLVCKGSSGSGNKSSGGMMAASTSYIIVIVILAVLLFASLFYIIVKQRAERAAPHSRKSMPTIISSEA